MKRITMKGIIAFVLIIAMSAGVAILYNPLANEITYRRYLSAEDKSAFSEKLSQERLDFIESKKITIESTAGDAALSANGHIPKNSEIRAEAVSGVDSKLYSDENRFIDNDKKTYYDIKVKSGRNEDWQPYEDTTVEVSIAVDNPDASHADIIHYLESPEAIARGEKRGNIFLEDLSGADAETLAALKPAIDAYKEVYGGDGKTVMYEEYYNLPVKDGKVTIDVSSFSIYKSRSYSSSFTPTQERDFIMFSKDNVGTSKAGYYYVTAGFGPVYLDTDFYTGLNNGYNRSGPITDWKEYINYLDYSEAKFNVKSDAAEGDMIEIYFKRTNGNKIYNYFEIVREYELNFHTNGSSTANYTKDAITGETVSFSTPAGRTGYTWGGWYDNSSFSGSSMTSYTPTKGTDLTKNFYAKWNPNIYKVTLDNQGAYSAGTAAYWYRYQTTSTVNGETIYYWTNDACTNPLYGYKITIPKKDGYVFGGYFTGTSGSGTQYVDANGTCINNLYNAVAANSTLYAKWTPISYTVAFNLNGATSGSASNMSFTWDEAKSLPTSGFERKYTVTYSGNGGTPSASSHVATATFNGWEDSATISYRGTEYSAEKFDAPYYANAYGDLYNAFNYNKYNLAGHYNNNGKDEGRNPKDPSGARNYYYASRPTVSNLTTTNGATVTLLANWTLGSVTLPSASRTGYTFNGWYNGSTKIGNAGATYTPSANITLTANWSAVSYSISYNLNGGSASGNPTSYTIESGAITLNNPTRAHYEFAGWTGSNGSTPQKTVTIPAGSTGNKSYTANWTAVSYPISYNLDGGSASGNPTSYTIESGAITLNNPTKSGYTFTGWTGTSLSGATMSVTIPSGSTGERAYTATWVKNEYTITWKNEDGTVLKTDKVKYNDTPSYSGTPTKASTAEFDYTFAGWSPSIVPATADATYTAQYSATTREYPITFKNDDGTVLETKPVEYGKTPTYTGSTPEKEQTESEVFTFVSWSPVINSVTGEAEYIAMYESSPRKYTIVWTNWDGSVLETDECEYGATPTYDSETPERPKDKVSSYEFANAWEPAVVPVAGDATYKAVFTATDLPPVADLVIETSGCKETQSFVFSVVSDEDATFKPIEVAIVGNGSATIKELPTGKYTVTEENGWTWRFSDEYEKPVTVTAGEENKVKFSNINEPTIKKWLSGLAALFK